MKSQNAWRQEEIDRLVMRNVSRNKEQEEQASQIRQLVKKSSFYRAVTISGAKRNTMFIPQRFNGSSQLTPQHHSNHPLTIKEEKSIDDTSSEEIKENEGALTDEDKILAELFNTNVKGFLVRQTSSM